MIGCGQAKQDVDGTVAAADLYTSSYFSCKQRYAAARSQPADDQPEETPGWTILSAKHDVLWPMLEVEPYDVTIADLAEQDAPVAPGRTRIRGTRGTNPGMRRGWIFGHGVHFGLASWLGYRSGFPEHEPHCSRLEVVAGQDYIAPLHEHDVFDVFPWDTTFPLQRRDFVGIGKQMQYLSEAAEQYVDGGVPGQTVLEDWTDEYEQAELDSWTEDCELNNPCR